MFKGSISVQHSIILVYKKCKKIYIYKSYIRKFYIQKVSSFCDVKVQRFAIFISKNKVDEVFLFGKKLGVGVRYDW